MVRIQLGEARRGEDGLRSLLLRSRDLCHRFSAAYNLASSLRKQGKHERAHAYARRALELADGLGSDDSVAASHNLRANILLSQSYVDEALAAYRTSWELRRKQRRDTRYSEAILLDNMGYCLLLQGELESGCDHIEKALRLAQDVGDRRCRAEALQDLCYGYLLRERYDDAVAMGRLALELAVSAGYDDIEEHCHYLLGEVGNRTEDEALRDEHFRALQARHPELPFLKDFLCAVDVTKIITLKG